MIKLLTHNDLDGVSCYILAQLLINDEVDVEFCTHQTIEEKLSETILELEKYESVYLTDIHVSLAYVHQFFTPEVVKKVHIFDHHQTGAELNNYEFAKVVTYYNNRLTCGTELFFKHLTLENSSQNLNKFVELVRSYDTWDWFKENNQEAKDLNDLFYIKGINAFVKQIRN